MSIRQYTCSILLPSIELGIPESSIKVEAVPGKACESFVVIMWQTLKRQDGLTSHS
jgi:hypothetical protein